MTPPPTRPQRKKVLAVASSGGHWAQLLRLRSAFEGHEAVFVTTQSDSRGDVASHRFHCIPDANRNSKLRMVLLMLRTFLVVLRERPDVVVSTGAAPGYFALRFGR